VVESFTLAQLPSLPLIGPKKEKLTVKVKIQVKEPKKKPILSKEEKRESWLVKNKKIIRRNKEIMK